MLQSSSTAILSCYSVVFLCKGVFESEAIGCHATDGKGRVDKHELDREAHYALHRSRHWLVCGELVTHNRHLLISSQISIQQWLDEAETALLKRETTTLVGQGTLSYPNIAAVGAVAAA